MSSQDSSVLQAKRLLTGLVIGESPRWPDGRLWFANCGRWVAFPNGMAVTPDNSTLIIAELRREADGVRHRRRRRPL
jgi:hypothetical protein